MAFSHLDKNIVFDPHTEQLHVDGNKALIYAHLAELAAPAVGQVRRARAQGLRAEPARSTRGASTGPSAPPGIAARTTRSTRRRRTASPTPTAAARSSSTIGGPGDLQRRHARRRVGGERGRASAPAPRRSRSSARAATTTASRRRTTTRSGSRSPRTTTRRRPPVYAQAGVTAAVNYPQATKPDGTPVKWRALVSRPGRRCRARTSSSPPDRRRPTAPPAATAPPEPAAYDVANTDFFRDLDRFVAKPREDFDAIDPRDGHRRAPVARRVRVDRAGRRPAAGLQRRLRRRTRPTGGPPRRTSTYTGNGAAARRRHRGHARRVRRAGVRRSGRTTRTRSRRSAIEWELADERLRHVGLPGRGRPRASRSASRVCDARHRRTTRRSTLRSRPPASTSVRVKNYASAEPTFTGTVTFTARSRRASGGEHVHDRREGRSGPRSCARGSRAAATWS